MISLRCSCSSEGWRRPKNVGIVFFMDEIQFVKEEEFRALITALHRASQKQLPVTLAAAGLPQIPRLAGEARSDAERLFAFPESERLKDPPRERPWWSRPNVRVSITRSGRSTERSS